MRDFELSERRKNQQSKHFVENSLYGIIYIFVILVMGVNRPINASY